MSDDESAPLSSSSESSSVESASLFHSTVAEDEVELITVMQVSADELRTLRRSKCQLCGNSAAKKVLRDTQQQQVLCHHCYLGLKGAPHVRLVLDDGAKEQLQKAKRESSSSALGVPPELQSSHLDVLAMRQQQIEAARRATPISEAVLFHVKGAREPLLVRMVPPLAASLNSGDTFVLQSTRDSPVYVWNGATANKHERLRGVVLALELIEASVGTPAVVVYEESLTAADFWHSLGGSKVIRSAAAAGNDTSAVHSTYVLYVVAGDQLAEVSRGAMPDRSLLLPTGVFVLEVGSRVTVWLGQRAPSETKAAAAKLAEQHSQRTMAQTPTVEVDGRESVAFRAMVRGFENPKLRKRAKKALKSGEFAWRVNTLHVQPPRISDTDAVGFDGVISTAAPRREALESAVAARQAAQNLNLADNGDVSSSNDRSGAGGSQSSTSPAATARPTQTASRRGTASASPAASRAATATLPAALAAAAAAAAAAPTAAMRLDSLAPFDTRLVFAVTVRGAAMFGAVSDGGVAVLHSTIVCAERLIFGSPSIYLEAISKGLVQVVDAATGGVKTLVVLNIRSN
jgi:hypothetical protein